MEYPIICPFCKKPVDPREKGTYKQVTGWVENRSGGGAHSVALPSAPHAFAHRMCIKLQASGISPDQGALFGE